MIITDSEPAHTALERIENLALIIQLVSLHQDEAFRKGRRDNSQVARQKRLRPVIMRFS